MTDADPEIVERVINAIRRVVTKKDVTIDTSFDAIGIDSLDAIEILFEVEEEFDISIPNESAQDIRSVREVVDGVVKYLARQK